MEQELEKETEAQRKQMEEDMKKQEDETTAPK